MAGLRVSWKRSREAPFGQTGSGKILYLLTEFAPFPLAPSKIFEEFERIHARYEAPMGWAPPGVIPINLIEDGRWPNPGATAFQNGGGVFFRAGAMATEQGNWLHEMTPMFYLAHFPRWLDEPPVRALTTLVWAPDRHPSWLDERGAGNGRRRTTMRVAGGGPASMQMKGAER